MAMETDLLRAALTVLLMVAFIGVWAWAWSRKRRSAFDQASRLPLEDDQQSVPDTPSSSTQEKE